MVGPITAALRQRGEDVPNYGRFLVGPNICLEAFALSAAETMHYDKAVIAFSIGGAPELVEHL